MTKKAIILLNIIADNKGGLTNSAIKKANTLTELDIETTIITYHNQKKLPVELYNLYKSSKLNKKVKIKNLYWDCTNLDYSKTKLGLIYSYFSKSLSVFKHYLKNMFTKNKKSMHIEHNKFLSETINSEDILFLEDNVQKWTNVLDDFKNKKVVTIHNNPEFDTTSKFIIENQDKYNIVNYLTKKQMHEFCENNAHYFPHGIDLYNKQNPNRVKRIVTLTRFNFRQKNVLDAIQAFANIKDTYPDFNYELYGDGPNKQEILDFISDLKLNDRVFIRPYTNNTDVVFQNSYASINLSYYEGFGLSILESLNNNCPCIASNVDYGPNEIITHGKNGFIVENDIEDITNVLSLIIKNNDYYYTNTFKYQNKDFSLESYKKNLLAQYNS